VLVIFSISYSYRLIFNFIQAFDMAAIERLQHTSLLGYSLLIFLLFFVGEVVPLFLIFLLQYHNHRLIQR
jgi:hypothetical protein